MVSPLKWSQKGSETKVKAQDRVLQVYQQDMNKRCGYTEAIYVGVGRLHERGGDISRNHEEGFVGQEETKAF